MGWLQSPPALASWAVAKKKKRAYARSVSSVMTNNLWHVCGFLLVGVSVIRLLTPSLSG